MISYQPFYETLLRENITEYALIFKHGIPANTLHRMKHGKPITTTILRVQIDTINILWLSFFNLQNHYKICAFPFFPAHPHGIGYRFLTCNFRLNGRFLSY